MSSFYEDTIHPRTGKAQRALWIDDYFGKHVYGVQFEGEEHVYRAKEIRTVSMFAAQSQDDKDRP